MINGSLFGALHQIENGESDLLVLCDGEGCTNGFIYTIGDTYLHSDDCPKCKGTGWHFRR